MVQPEFGGEPGGNDREAGPECWWWHALGTGSPPKVKPTNTTIGMSNSSANRQFQPATMTPPSTSGNLPANPYAATVKPRPASVQAGSGTRMKYHLWMVRSKGKARRLVVGEETFLWSLGHEHRVDQSQYQECREILIIRPFAAKGRLLIVFRQGSDQLVTDGCLSSGTVGTVKGGFLNLHEPGTIRALLEEAISHGWCFDNPGTQQMDGWALFDVVATRRGLVKPS